MIIRRVVSIAEPKEHLLSKLMKRHLSEVLHEGLLDSVLPFMVPKKTVSQPNIKKSIMQTTSIKKSASASGILSSNSSSASSHKKEKEPDRKALLTRKHSIE